MNSKDAMFAIYHDQAEIKVAVRSFVKLGFKKSAIWVLQSKVGGSKDFGQVQKYQFKVGALVGAFIGVVLVGGVLLLTDSAQMRGHWIMMIVGVIAGGLFGAAAGTLVGIGTPDPAAKRYGQYLQAGGILMSVHSESPKQVLQAQEVLSATGGQDIQLINEFKTWDAANLERIDLEKLEAEATAEL